MHTRCLADISGPFFDPQKPFRNWSAFPYTQIDLPSPPFVDMAQLQWGVTRAIAHLDALQQQGYTGIVLDNLAHLTTFDGPGLPVYPQTSPTRLRACAYQAAFRRLFAAAVDRGMELFITTDMQWSTPELRAAVGPIQANNQQLAMLNQRAIAELFALFPQVRGLIIRVGEAGGAHNQGDTYCGHMIYTSPTLLRNMIGALLPICEAAGRLLIVRTWSVGIGDLGDIISSPQRYHETFGGFQSAALLVSIKHGPADFFRLLPPNPTLGLPGPRQIIELQNRREYELFGLVPSSIAQLHGAVLASAATNPHYAGVWAWNSTGGWGGGQASLGATGWNFWTELSSALTAALVARPTIDTTAFIQHWVRLRLVGDAPPADACDFAAAVADLYRDSAALIERGWYVGAALQGSQRLGTIYLAPLLWVWWMRPTAALLIWAYLADNIGNLQTVLDAGQIAADEAAAHAERLAALTPGGDDATFIVRSARYFADVLQVAHTIKGLLLPLMAQAHQGTRPNLHNVRNASQQARIVLATHRATWGNDPNFPALELDEIEAWVGALEAHPRRMGLHIRAACMTVQTAKHARRIGQIGSAGVAGLILTLLRYRRGRIGLMGLTATLLIAAPLRRPALRLGIPWLTHRLHLLPSIFFEAGPSVGEWAS